VIRSEMGAASSRAVEIPPPAAAQYGATHPRLPTNLNPKVS
jgi:hypothetical protein